MDDITRAMKLDSPPLLGTLQFEECELRKPKQALRRHYVGPLFVSMCLHALGLYALVEHRIETPRESATATAAIHLQLVPPPQARAPEPLQATPIEAIRTPQSEGTVAMPPEAIAPPPPLVDLPQQPETLVATEPALPPKPSLDSPATTRLAVRQIVERLRSEEEQQSVGRVCTPLQKLNPMFLCADTASAAFDSAQQDVRDGFFSSSRGDADVIVSAARVRRIANSLRDSGMSQSDIDRYVEGIDVNAQEKSTSGDARASAARDQMFSNDSTYQLIKRVLNP